MLDERKNFSRKKWLREKILVVWNQFQTFKYMCIRKLSWNFWYYSTDPSCLLPQGAILNVQDAATRLHVLNRSALRSVQAQARIPGSQKEQVSTFSPWGEVLTPIASSSVTHSHSKQEEYVKVSIYRKLLERNIYRVWNKAILYMKLEDLVYMLLLQVAKTLFIDEALKPCPRCQSPAKYQPYKKRGLCSRRACGFDFCVLCLCAYHGSEECSRGTANPRNRKDVLPGSAQSKRNLKRL